MAKYYFEGHEILAPVTFESKDVVVSSESYSLRQFRRNTNAHRWDLTFSVLAKDNAETLLLGMLDNAVSTSSMAMPQLTSVYDKVTSVTSPTVSVAAAASASLVTASSTEVNKLIPKGTFIQFSNHSKIYVVTQNVTTSSSMAITVFPSLRVAVPLGTTIRHAKSPSKPSYTYYRSLESISGITFSDGVLSNPGTITLMEDV